MSPSSSPLQGPIPKPQLDSQAPLTDSYHSKILEQTNLETPQQFKQYYTTQRKSNKQKGIKQSTFFTGPLYGGQVQRSIRSKSQSRIPGYIHLKSQQDTNFSTQVRKEPIKDLKTIMLEIEQYEKKNPLEPKLHFKYCEDPHCGLAYSRSEHSDKKQFYRGNYEECQICSGNYRRRFKSDLIHEENQLISHFEELISHSKKEIVSLRNVNKKLNQYNSTLLECLKQENIRRPSECNHSKESQIIEALRNELSNKNLQINDLQIRLDKIELQRSIEQQKGVICARGKNLQKIESIAVERIQSLQKEYQQKMTLLEDSCKQKQERMRVSQSKLQTIMRERLVFEEQNVSLRKQIQSKRYLEQQILSIKQNIELIKKRMIEKIEFILSERDSTVTKLQKCNQDLELSLAMDKQSQKQQREQIVLLQKNIGAKQSQVKLESFQQASQSAYFSQKAEINGKSLGDPVQEIRNSFLTVERRLSDLIQTNYLNQGSIL